MRGKKEKLTLNADACISILNITQSVLYEEQSVKWFSSCLQLSAVQTREALLYLQNAGYVKIDEADMVSAAKDIRLRVRGKYQTTENGDGVVIVDAQRMVAHGVHVPRAFGMGARHNDRVLVAIQGAYLISPQEKCWGVVEEIVEPYGNYFCGTVRYIDGKWYVFPTDKRTGSSFELHSIPESLCSGDGVFVRFSDAYCVRNQTPSAITSYETETFKERRQEVSETHRTKAVATCEYVCKYYSVSEMYAYQNRLHRMYTLQALKEAEVPTLPKRFPNGMARRDLTNLQTVIIMSDRAYSALRMQDGFRVYVHVADLTEQVFLNTALDREMRGKGAFPDFLPRSIMDRCRFQDKKKQNALTVEFQVNMDGNMEWSDIYRSSILCGKEEPEALRAVKQLIRPDDIFEKDVLVHAAEFAVRDYFERDGFPAPYMNRYKSAQWQPIRALLDAFGLHASDTFLNDYLVGIMESAKTEEQKVLAEVFVRRLVSNACDWVCKGEASKVEFCRPFSSYLSVAAQYAYVQKQRRLSREAYAAFSRQMQEITATYLWQREAYMMLRRVMRNEKKYNLKYQNSEIAPETALIVDRIQNGTGYYILCDGVIARLETTDTGLKAGDRACVCFNRMTRIGTWLCYTLAQPTEGASSASEK